MSDPSTPSMAGPARRSRRLQGKAASASVGHTGSATTATGSPYARRPALPRDSSSQTLAALESGGSSGRTVGSGLQDQDNSSQRKSTRQEGFFGRVKRGFGWLIGGSQPSIPDDILEEVRDSHAAGRDEESSLSGSTQIRKPPSTSASNAASASGSSLRHTSDLHQNKRIYRPTPSVLSSLGGGEGIEASSAKKLRTSHSTLNLPVSPPRVARAGHASAGPGTGRRSPSPQRALSPRARGPPVASTSAAHIFPSGPFGLPTPTNANGNSIYASRRSVSPGAASQHALGQLVSTSSSTFGLQSQSPFRSVGRSARSPDFAALNISNGLARSPSLPRERLNSLSRPASRLYPYQRSPSILSGVARTSGLVPSYSVDRGLAGVKRNHAAASYSPPKGSPLPHSALRASPSYMHISPTGTDFGSEASHRSKRQRTGIVWSLEKGFVYCDADGRSSHVGSVPTPEPKNEADKLMEKLEIIRQSDSAGLRGSSPRRINVPVPASTPSGSSIFATQISASRTAPSLSAHAISPQARRQQVLREERSLRRRKLSVQGGLGTRLRMENSLIHNRETALHDATSDSEVEYVRSEAAEQNMVDDAQRTDRDGADDIEELAGMPEAVIDSSQPVSRRTRQRTREASVMSEDSQRQEQEPTFSPRRSTRIRKPEQSAKDVQRSARVRKSAKSPPTRNAPPARRAEDQVDDMYEDARQEGDSSLGKQSSPSRTKSPAAVQIPERITSPVSTSHDAAVAHVKSLPDRDRPLQVQKDQATVAGRSTREERLSRTQVRRVGGFSARDDTEEDGMQHSGVESSRSAQQPKLQLPKSVFSNRFSFGRSPSTSNLPSPKMLPATAVLSELPAGQTSELSTTAQSLPKFTLPPSLQSTANSVSTPQPANTAATSSSAASSSQFKSDNSAPAKSTPTTASALAPAKSMFTFNPTAVPSGGPPNGGLAAASPAATDVGHSGTPGFPAPSTSAFTFKKPSSANADPVTARPKEITAAAPGLGGLPQFTTSASSFSSASDSATATATAAPAKATNPFAAFPSNVPHNDRGTTPATSNPPLFTFGSKAPAMPSPGLTAAGTSGNAPASNFQFGTPQVAEAAGEQRNLSGGSTAGVPSTTMGISAPNGLQAKPEATSGTSSHAASVSKPLSFAFGQSANTTAAPAAPIAVTSTAAAPPHSPASSPFVFGQSKPADDSKSRAASPFAQAPLPAVGGFGAALKAASPVPAFGVGSATANPANNQPTTTPSFTFGNAPSAANPTATPAFGQATPSAAQPTTSNPFAAVAGPQGATAAFGPSANNAPGSSAPAFTFGQSTVKPAAATPSFGAFGSGSVTQAQTNGQGATTPGFAFGAANTGSMPAFSFGGNANQGQAFAFGGAGGANAASVGMGSAPSFSAGGGTQSNSPAGTPTDNGPAGGLFNMGAGDDSTSPNKTRRPTKPLRRTAR